GRSVNRRSTDLQAIQRAAIGVVIGLAACTSGRLLPAEADRTLSGFDKLLPATDWPWWRGPMRNGIAPANANPPTTWSESENIAWKVPVPGRGHASPIVVGEQVFLATAEEDEQVQSVIAFDRSTGKQLWKTEANRGGFPHIHTNNTHASPTIACDGDLLFATFHHHDQLQAIALGRGGKIAWNKSLGEFHPRRYEFGYAPSPVVYRNTVIVAAEFDGDSSLTALDRRTGAMVWRTPRPANITFSTPSINVIGARELLTISGNDQVSCYDPATGRPLWSVDATTLATCGTVVWDGDLLFASGGFPKSETVGIRVGDRGTVLWKNQQKCYEESMLAYRGHLYALTGKGVLYCFRGDDGQQMWQQRLHGPVSASPVLAGGHIYWANERGTMYVFKPKPDACELVAENVLGDESFASPAVSGDRLFLRVAKREGDLRQEYLVCIGRPESIGGQ
ncbi:MAG TPA: PQQ-binding-like beta-propeller repeat protein, partial [Pirellulales bacterium]|nr:PQQ-binding-like beta-propeller repeat protein [Pirellulales bacterium]